MKFDARPSLFAAAIAAGLVALPARGASVAVTAVEPNYSTAVNLTAEGTTDWGLWSYGANPIQAGQKASAPSNSKLVGTAIGSALTVNGDARGTGTSLPTLSYNYTDGTTPVAASGSGNGIFFDSTLATATSGFSLTIAGGAAGVPQVAHLYVTGFSGAVNAVATSITPTFSVSLPGASTVTDSSVTYSASRPITRYTLQFTPDNAGDLLTVSYTTGTPVTASSSAHVALQAATVSPVPEPGSALLVGLAAAALVSRRRRRA